MEVKEGYKLTEAGTIPIDWNIYSIGDMLDFQGGSQPDKNTFSSSKKLGYIRLIQIRDYKTDKFLTYIPSDLARRFCDETDIMIGRYGPPVFQILRGIKGAYNVALIKVIPHTEIDKNYAYYYLKQEKLFSFIEKLSRRSSGQTGVDLMELRAYPLPLPNKPEQQAIAKALSDVDVLIESLEQLIVKKRHVKQGAMQELLTGKRRLPGFEVEKGYRQMEDGEIPLDWKVVNASDIGTFKGGNGFPVVYQGNSSEKYPFFKVSDMNNLGNEILMQNANNSITETIRQRIGATVFPKHTILFAKVGAAIFLERKKLLTKDSCIDNNMAGFVIDKGVDHNFIYHFLHSFKLSNLVSTTALPSLSGNVLNKIKILLPSNVKEQKAIASILSDMDTEVKSLEIKLEKTKKLKAGMMHELLTGRIRLV